MTAVRPHFRSFLSLGLVIIIALISYAADPPGGTVSEASPTVSWTGPFKTPTASAACNGPNDPRCDNFSLTIVPPSPSFGPYVVKITLQPFAAGDWDVTVFDPNGGVAGSSGNAPSAPEFVTLSNPAAGTYVVAAAPFAPSPGLPSYSATAELAPGQDTTSAPGNEPIRYANHVAPPPLGQPGSDEPSIGCNHNSDKVMFIGALETYRVSFDNCTSPAEDTWLDKSFIYTSLVTLDPILFTDRVTGRTIVSQLSAKCSSMAFTDDDGNTWTPTQGCGINSGVDHQTVGGGPFAAPLARDPDGPAYPHAVYYCSQDLAVAQCARSDTGSLTFGPAVPIYDLTECGGLHGQVKVSPADGTVYVPNRGCNGEQAVVVSEDNGVSWTVRKIPGAAPGSLDPSVAIASDGTVYFGWNNAGAEPMVAVSKDKGQTWFNIRNVAGTFDIKSTIFPAIVAGDPDRAAIAFHGSSTAGGGGDDPDWPGDWFLFVAHTYDGGATWTTVNATPGDPVQRGTICPFGIGCENGTRNLLDFFGATIDREGRVLVGYADGCIGDCVKQRPNSFTARSTIARQSGGRRMFAAFDVVAVPASPLVTATFDACPDFASVLLSWSPPDDHGSAISGYRIYRRTAGSDFLLLATVGADVNFYQDNTINPAETYFYRVTAVNQQGESRPCGEVSPACAGGGEPEDACTLPGITVLTDGTNDFTLPVGMPTLFGPALDIQKLSIAEPFGLGPGKIMFILKMVSLQNVPPSTTWPILFRAPNGLDFSARMHTNALGQVSFTLATGTNTSPVTNPGVPADPASGFSADGAIRIVVSRSAIGADAGLALTQFLIRVRSPEGGAALTPDNMPDSLARTGTYTIVGSENCGTPPDAIDDSATTKKNHAVVIDVVANDKVTHPPLQVISVTQPSNGAAVNNLDGTVTYRPDRIFVGTDSFKYTVCDSNNQCDSATVTVTVRKGNQKGS